MALDEARRTGALRTTQIPVLDPNLLPPGLAPREAEIVLAIVAGMSTAEICKKFQISEKTLEGYITSARRRFDGPAKGRRGILDGVKALQAMATVPAVLITTTMLDGMVALPDLL